MKTIKDNPNLIFNPLKLHSKEWFEFRKNGIGSSESAGVLTLHDYIPAIKVYHEKIGMYDIPDIMNEKMSSGLFIENHIADLWSFWDGEDYVENKFNNNIIRKCYNTDDYIVNKKYPWLYTSVDRIITPDTAVNMSTGEPLKKEGIVECKNTTYYSRRKHEDSFPKYWTIQIQQQLAVTELDYAELAILTDGWHFEVRVFERDQELIDRILSITKKFWYNRVMPGKRHMEKRNKYYKEGNIRLAEEYTAAIDSLEPDADDTPAYIEYLSKRHIEKTEGMKFEGTEKEYKYCKRWEMAKNIKKFLDREIQLQKNKLAKVMVDASVNGIEFGAQGKVDFRKSQESSTKKSVYLYLNNKPEEDIVKEEYNKLNLNY